MKATLEFSLPEELEEFKIASEAPNLVLDIQQYSDYLRGLSKYGHSFNTPEDAIEAIRMKLYELLEDYSNFI